MKAEFTLALLATASTAYKLKDWTANPFNFAMTGYVNWTMAAEWYYGLRSPVQWAKYEHWHESISWGEEIFTKLDPSTTVSFGLKDANGAQYQDVVVFGVDVKPHFLIFDLVFLENQFYFWPETNEDLDAEAYTYCNYMGWWYKALTLYVDLKFTTRNCNYGLYGTVFEDGEWQCGTNSYSLPKTKAWKMKPFSLYKQGMYGWGWNTCEDIAAFDARYLEEGSLLDSLKETSEDY